CSELRGHAQARSGSHQDLPPDRLHSPHRAVPDHRANRRSSARRHMTSSLYLLAVSFGLTAAFTPLARAVATRRGFVATPKEDRWHRRPTALLGGPAIVVSALLSAVLLGGFPRSPLWLSIAMGAVGMAAVGLVDDLIRIRP